MMSFSLRPLPLALAIGSFSTLACASGFQLLEQNASGLGNAYAGSAAVAQDASTIFFNPAGLSLLEGRQFSVGMTGVIPSYKFTNNGSTNPTAMGGGAATGATSDAGGLGWVPNAYLAVPLNKTVTLGLGISAPFGLKTEYTPGWAGQYQSNKFDVRTMNVNPTIAWRATDKLSLGFGVDWQKLSAEYVKMSVVGAGVARLATVELSDSAWGWNAGAIYQLSDRMRLGFSYRSAIQFGTTGSLTLSGVSAGAASANVKLPATWVWSVYQTLGDRWEMMGDISRTEWSSIQNLAIVNYTGNTDMLDLRFRNTWRVAFGGAYQYSDAWKLRFGIAYDQTPVASDAYRPVSLPDNDRWWLSFGAQYRPSRESTVDIGYTHLFLKDPVVSTNGGSTATKGVVNGSYSASADILGVQYSQKF